MNGEYYLVHHGILGQRKGVKHGPPYPLKDAVSKAVRKSKEVSSVKKEEHKHKTVQKKNLNYYNKEKKRDISKLTDDELQRLIDRLTLEKTYLDLLKQTTPKEKNKAESWLKNEAKNAGSILISKAATNIGDEITKKAAKKISKDLFM